MQWCHCTRLHCATADKTEVFPQLLPVYEVTEVLDDCVHNDHLVILHHWNGILTLLPVNKYGYCKR